MEEVEILGETPNDNLKEIELIKGNIKYKIEIKKEKDDLGDYLDISVYNNKIKYNGIIHIYFITMLFLAFFLSVKIVPSITKSDNILIFRWYNKNIVKFREESLYVKISYC